MNSTLGTWIASAFLLISAASPAIAADPAKVVLVAGKPSHGPGDHEFNAGSMLLAKCLKETGRIDPVVVKGGWPDDESVFKGASTIVFFMDGGGAHPMIQEDRLDRVLKPLMDQGVGLVCMHYAVEVPKGKAGDAFLDWLGGYYESGYSTNPHWTAEIKSLPEHPITRGVKPFAVRDEWYYNLRFRPDMAKVTPILVAVPDEETRQGKTSSPRGPYPHVVAAKGREEVLAWSVERPDSGRSFGFTGGHSHKNWDNADFRKLVLNAIFWTAKVEVPSDGVDSKVSADELGQNLDPKRK